MQEIIIFKFIFIRAKCSPLNTKMTELSVIFVFSGERGIRTLGAVACTLPFQDSRLNHSRISPFVVYR